MSPLEHFEHPLHVLVHVKHHGNDRLLAGKRKQLPGYVRGTIGGLVNFLKVGMQRMGWVHILQGQFCITQDHAEHIVEIVGHAARQSSHRFHLLGLVKLPLQFLPFLLFQLLFGDISHHCKRADLVA